MDRLAIHCANIGSIKRGNFGWAVVDNERQRDGADIRALVDDMVGVLRTGWKIGLGFNVRCGFPCPLEPAYLTAGADGWQSRSAGAEASVLSARPTDAAGF